MSALRNDEPPAGLDRYETQAWYSARTLARAAEYNARFATSLQDWSDAHPFKPCPEIEARDRVHGRLDARCVHGSRETRDAAGVLVAITNCTTCKGLGRVAMSADEIRDEYRRVRASACANGLTTGKAFDAKVARSVQATGKSVDLAPGHWLAAARRIAAGRDR